MTMTKAPIIITSRNSSCGKVLFSGMPGPMSLLGNGWICLVLGPFQGVGMPDTPAEGTPLRKVQPSGRYTSPGRYPALEGTPPPLVLTSSGGYQNR